MKLNSKDCMEERLSEEYLIKEVSKFTKVEKCKLVEITDTMLMDDNKYRLLKKLKEYKYSLQYIIE